MSAPVWATDPGRAETLIDEANRLRSHGQNQKALPLMKEAYDLAPSPRTAGQLGLAEMAVGYWAEADRHLDEALAAPGHPWISKNRSALEAAQKTVRTHLTTFSLDGEPTGAEVFANGQPVGRLPLSSLTLGEGRITFSVRAPGFTEQTKQVTVAGGAQSNLTFALSPVRVESAAKPRMPSPVPAAPPSPSKPKDVAPGARNRLLPITLAAGAGVALGFAVWQHITWQGAIGDFEKVDGCYAGLPMRGTSPRCQGLYDSIGTHRTLTFVGYGAAGLLAAGAGVAYWLGSSPAKSSSDSGGISLAHVAFGSAEAPLSVIVTGSF